MSKPPAPGPDYGGFDDVDDDQENRTVVDNSLWSQPKIPYYPAIANFGRFEILGRIARGGMAEVYLARDKQADGEVRHIVLKRVLPEMEDDENFLALFLEEGRTAVRLYHQNVCHVFEVGEINGRAFMALEWVYGVSLHDLIKRVRERDVLLGWPVVAEVISCVASALQYVHHAKGLTGQPLNIVHRDVSPHNVMLTWAGGVKLLDFGIAKTSSSKANEPGTAGKYAYMSPEQAQSKPMDGRSDIFALGIVAYEALTGQWLYDRPILMETLNAVVREPVPSVRAVREDIPEELDQIVRKALAKDPAQRFQSAGEMRTAIQNAQRASGQIVTSQRIGLTLNNLFALFEKEPLNAMQRRVTGTFSAMSGQEASAVLARQEPPQEEETFQFDHASEPPPTPEPQRAAPQAPPAVAARVAVPPELDVASAAAPAPAPKKKSRALRWIAITLLVIIALAAGGYGGLWYMRGQMPPWPPALPSPPF